MSKWLSSEEEKNPKTLHTEGEAQKLPFQHSMALPLEAQPPKHPWTHVGPRRPLHGCFLLVKVSPSSGAHKPPQQGLEAFAFNSKNKIIFLPGSKIK